MHAGVGPIYDVDESPIVNLDVVGLDDSFTLDPILGFLTLGLRFLGGCGDKEGHLPGVEGVSNVHGPDPGVEVGHKHHSPIIDGGEGFVGGMGSETAAPLAEGPA